MKPRPESQAPNLESLPEIDRLLELKTREAMEHGPEVAAGFVLMTRYLLYKLTNPPEYEETIIDGYRCLSPKKS